MDGANSLNELSNENHHTAKVKTAEWHIEDHNAYWAWADSRRQIAIHLDEEYPVNAIGVPHRLLGESFELGFKAFLCLKNISIKERRSLGHNLISLLERCNQLGLNEYVSFEEIELSHLSKLNDFYVNKRFDYWDSLAESNLNLPGLVLTGYKGFPSLSPLKTAVNKLLSSIQNICFRQNV